MSQCYLFHEQELTTSIGIRQVNVVRRTPVI